MGIRFEFQFMPAMAEKVIRVFMSLETAWSVSIMMTPLLPIEPYAAASAPFTTVMLRMSRLLSAWNAERE